MPIINSRRVTGASAQGPFGAGYRTPNNRYFTFEASVDMTTLPTLPERMDDAFEHALMFHLEDAAQRVIDTTRGYLVRLEEPPVKVTAGGREIHGYDTGLMYVTLRYQLAFHLLTSGVYYDLFSSEARYWRFVEFGHWFRSADGWMWWEGYHMLETAIEENAGYIRQRVREAWADTAIQLAMEAHKPGSRGRLGFTDGPGLP